MISCHVIFFMIIISVATAEFTKPTEESCIGIDLGTRYTRLRVYQSGTIKRINNELGEADTASCIALSTEGELVVGEIAKQASNGICEFKAWMGNLWTNVTVLDDTNIPLKFIEKQNRPGLQFKTSNGNVKVLTSEEIVALLLSNMKKTAEAYLNKKVRNCVLSVPTSFNSLQRQAMIQAGQIAGFKVVGLINEPTAAAMALDFYTIKNDINIIVYNLGAGYFDITLMTIGHGLYEVIATNGEFFGCKNFEHRVLNHFVNWYKINKGKDIRQNTTALRTLYHEVQKVTKKLSSNKQALIEIKSFFDGKDFKAKLTREQFENLNVDLIRETIRKMHDLLTSVNWKKEQIKKVLLTGGCSKIPLISELIKQYFNYENLIEFPKVDDAAAYGAAVMAAIYSDEINGLNVIEVSSHDIFYKNNDKMIKTVKKFTIIPTSYDLIVPSYNSIRLYESVLKDKNVIGIFNAFNIKPIMKTKSSIEIKISVDSNGVLYISDLKNQTQKLYNYCELSDRDISIMKKNIEDIVSINQKECLDTRNKAIRLIKWIDEHPQSTGKITLCKKFNVFFENW